MGLNYLHPGLVEPKIELKIHGDRDEKQRRSKLKLKLKLKLRSFLAIKRMGRIVDDS